ncbi:MAG: carbonic anhydrase [Planctomycetes bacterium]|nr:carbonic anhydrase [Planctomycetota bacterium]
MRRSLFATSFVAVVVSSLAVLAHFSEAKPLSGALGELVEGNRRFVGGHFEHARIDKVRRDELAKGQHPFAVVVGCSDSRVPPELVFDQGLGDLFVVRVAGNVIDDASLGSIEYAVEHLGASLVIVLGHERCGAVKAALDGAGLPGHIGAIGAALSPAIAEAKSQPSTDPLDAAVRANVRRIVKQLSNAEPILTHALHADEIAVIGARYDLDTGEVEFFPEAAEAHAEHDAPAPTGAKQAAHAKH